MDTTLSAIAILAWTFLMGMLAGIGLEGARARRAKRYGLDHFVEQAKRLDRSTRLFAGMPTRSFTRIVDEEGAEWRITMEREKE